MSPDQEISSWKLRKRRQPSKTKIAFRCTCLTLVAILLATTTSTLTITGSQFGRQIAAEPKGLGRASSESPSSVDRKPEEGEAYMQHSGKVIAPAVSLGALVASRAGQPVVGDLSLVVGQQHALIRQGLAAAVVVVVVVVMFASVSNFGLLLAGLAKYHRAKR